MTISDGSALPCKLFLFIAGVTENLEYRFVALLNKLIRGVVIESKTSLLPSLRQGFAEDEVSKTSRSVMLRQNYYLL